MLRRLLCFLLAIPVVFIVLHTIIRIIRHFYKFPIPEFLVGLIDHPLRRKFQPPYETAVRHGLEPGMLVLEVGRIWRIVDQENHSPVGAYLECG